MSSRPLIIGHRGASAVAPENTLASFKRALSDGADGIEFDVRLAHDNVPVVIHDATLRRTGLISGRVSELSSIELGRTDVGSWFDRQARSSSPAQSSKFTEEKLPTLQQVFDLFRDNQGLLYLEMKGEPQDGDRLVKEVVRSIRDNSLRDRVIAESFDLSLIKLMKSIESRIRTAALFEPKLSRPVWLARTKLPERARACGADEIALHHTLASQAAIEKAKGLGLNVVVWTVDDPQWVAKALTLGIDALITNNPAALVAYNPSSSAV
ncbi:MAG: glycerophosphodiester phosphodiesterase family protein [Acidobacteriota bacterium]